MKRILALLLTILFLSSGMALAQEGGAEAADQEVADTPGSGEIAGEPIGDIFSALAALNNAESKSSPYGFFSLPAGDKSAMWLKRVGEDNLIVITFTFADDGSVLTENMSAANTISEMLLMRDYTNPKAVAASMTYSNIRMEQTLIIPNLTDEQVLQYASDLLENLTDEYFMEILAAAGEIKMDKLSFKFPIEKGNKGDGVKFVQQKLIELGCLAGKADGDFGNKSKAAVEKFQEDNNMEVTGALDFYGFIKLISR